ncbi:LysR family transcriptional regulator [Novosphingobium sp. FKTRR1]|uniref:LysR family transcriptional regulator n=1 Tax=Novosphingobium sp. FKTRR1 TaxID=2879118 RepID=UPI001CF09C03|nr:LysR family transcriptional regulator [Novosphingobium sp. FKTRR1]
MLKRVQVRQFLAVVDTGSFTAAARQLHVTQPTLSSGIAELEKIVGSRLFERERRAIRLTEAGNRLLGPARAIEREFRNAEALVNAAPTPLPPLRLGVLTSLPSRLVAAIAATGSAGRPLALTEASDGELRHRLADHRLDAALTLLRTGEAGECLIDEGYAMILGEDHPLAHRDRLAPEELAGETMIARRSCEILAQTSRFFTARGVRPRFVLRSTGEDRCLALVAAGAGVTTGPISLVGKGTVAIPLDGYDFRRRIGLVTGHGAQGHDHWGRLRQDMAALCAKLTI